MVENWREVKNLEDLVSNMPEAKAEKEELEDYIIRLSSEYTKERARDAFGPYVIRMIRVGAAAFMVAFLSGYLMFHDSSNSLELSFIVGISATAAAAIAFSALGGNAIQRQSDRLSALTFAMDDISDRISSKELDEAGRNIGKRKSGGGDEPLDITQTDKRQQESSTGKTK